MRAASWPLQLSVVLTPCTLQVLAADDVLVGGALYSDIKAESSTWSVGKIRLHNTRGCGPMGRAGMRDCGPPSPVAAGMHATCGAEVDIPPWRTAGQHVPPQCLHVPPPHACCARRPAAAPAADADAHVLAMSLLKRCRRGHYADGSTNADTYWRSLLKGTCRQPLQAPCCAGRLAVGQWSPTSGQADMCCCLLLFAAAAACRGGSLPAPTHRTASCGVLQLRLRGGRLMQLCLGRTAEPGATKCVRPAPRAPGAPAEPQSACASVVADYSMLIVTCA
jgi:hypothetical protein